MIVEIIGLVALAILIIGLVALAINIVISYLTLRRYRKIAGRDRLIDELKGMLDEAESRACQAELKARGYQSMCDDNWSRAQEEIKRLEKEHADYVKMIETDYPAEIERLLARIEQLKGQLEIQENKQ